MIMNSWTVNHVLIALLGVSIVIANESTEVFVKIYPSLF